MASFAWMVYALADLVLCVAHLLGQLSGLLEIVGLWAETGAWPK